MSKELVEIAVEIVRETALAYGVSDGTQDMDLGDGKQKLVWLPKSQVEIVSPGIIEMPEWLAEAKGLL